MSRDGQRLADYLGHILEAIERIEGYTEGMGHPDFTAANPNLPLNAAYQMRNAVAHGYFKVDLDIVWETVRCELPKLRVQVETLRAHTFRTPP